MSVFGDGSFNQSILDEIKYQIGNHNMTYIDACSSISEILSYLIPFAFYDDESYKKIKEKCYTKAKKDILDALEK